MSEKFTIAVWNADGTPKTGASVALLGAGTYSGTELGASGRYYWASIPLGKYFLRVNGVDTGESFAVGDGEVAGLGYSDRAFIKSSANSLNLANLVVDDIESLQGTLDNKLDVIDKKSQIINGTSLLEFEALSGDGGSYFHTLKQVGSKNFESFVTSSINGSFLTSSFNEPSVSSSSAQIVAQDGMGKVGATWRDLVTGDYSNFELSASVDGIKIQHEINGVVDFLLLPTVTGETKTLATTADVGESITNHIADADPHTQYRLKSASVPWGELSGVPTSFAPSAHATSHAIGGSDPITEIGDITLTDGTTTITNSNVKITKTAGGLPLALETSSTDSSTNRSGLTIKRKTTVLASGDFGSNLLFLAEDSAGVEKAQGAIVLKRGGSLSNGSMTFQTAFGSVLQDSLFLDIDKSAKFYGNLLPQEKLITTASTTTRAGVNLPHSTAPTSPVNGDKWTTTAGEFTRVNGVTYETAVKSSLGNLQLISLGNTAIGQNATTNERGHLVRMINGTGSASVKGTLISASTTTDNQFVLQANEFDAFGVVAESGIASGQECWIWVNGSTCEVLWENGQSSTRGYLAICAPTDGRATNVAVPDSNPTVGEHFKEIGHVLQSKASGTDVMVLCQIHFN